MIYNPIFKEALISLNSFSVARKHRAENRSVLKVHEDLSTALTPPQEK